MIYVLFRWEIDPDLEHRFMEGWSELVHRNIEKYGALGSRLHRTADNHLISYSKWISEEHFIKAQNLQDSHEAARQKMLSAIISADKPMVMVPTLDHIIAS